MPFVVDMFVVLVCENSVVSRSIWSSGVESKLPIGSRARQHLIVMTVLLHYTLAQNCAIHCAGGLTALPSSLFVTL